MSNWYHSFKQIQNNKTKHLAARDDTVALSNSQLGSRGSHFFPVCVCVLEKQKKPAAFLNVVLSARVRDQEHTKTEKGQKQ